MALDESKDTDKVHEVDGFTFVVNQDFLEKAQPIKVDFNEWGFKLDCAIDFGAGCSSCSSTGSCCS